MSRTTPAQSGPVELKALQGQVKHLVEDLRQQVPADEALLSSLKAEYAGAKDAHRVGASFESWLEDVLDQAAVAWVLGCVFVRFCEDNGLVEKLWIGGPESHAPVERAVQNRQAYLIANPRHNDRHWLRSAFEYLAGLHPTGKIFDEHNPVWRFDISGEAAEALSDFFRRGAGYASLRTLQLDTRFLGDLYQDLSQHARDTYALLQTPEFVEEFILDRTFEPAVREFGLANTSVIDPTCGSGHFLLGAFHRLVRMWKDREPGTDVRELVERALGQVTGVDINAFAVAIARRYTVVVGNPPYVTVKDKALNETYREIYKDVCHRQYAMTVPFAKRFFELAKRSDENGEGAGWVGQITANSFMKREFGKKLIENYFQDEVELTEVIDTSGAFIPGHGTPTVILIGRPNKRRRAATVRAVLGVRGEPEQPDVPAKGHVWTAIVSKIDRPGSESE